MKPSIGPEIAAIIERELGAPADFILIVLGKSFQFLSTLPPKTVNEVFEMLPLDTKPTSIKTYDPSKMN